MTAKVAIKILKELGTKLSADENKAIKMAIKALKNQDKHQYHNLRKDATDLPEKGRWLSVVFQEDKNYQAYAAAIRDDIGFWDGIDYNNGWFTDIKAWKYQEPFKGE